MTKKSTELAECREEANRLAPFSLLVRALGVHENRDSAYDEVIEEIIQAVMTGVESADLDLESLLRLKLPEEIFSRIKRFRAAIQTTSMLDEPTLGLTGETEIDRTLENLGVDLDNPAEFKYAQEVFAEAFLFLYKLLKKHGKTLSANLHPEILKDLKSNIGGGSLPREEEDIILKDIAKKITRKDIYKFFQCSAGSCHNLKNLVSHSCALLRVAYVVDFIRSDSLISNLPVALEELDKRQDKHIDKRKTTEGTKWFYKLASDTDLPILLEMVEIRTKELFRIISKLLHKPGNSSEKVLDHIGMRITTTNPSDTLRLIYYMFINPSTSMFPSASIRVGETTNLILNADNLLQILHDPTKARELVDTLSVDTIDHEELVDVSEGGSKGNKHSMANYKSIHIVVDMPVRLPDGRKIIFPIEIQILDMQSSIKNEAEAPHGTYVHMQEEEVIDRVVDSNNLEQQVLEEAKKKQELKKAKKRSKPVPKLRVKQRKTIRKSDRKKTTGKTLRAKKKGTRKPPVQSVIKIGSEGTTSVDRGKTPSSK